MISQKKYRLIRNGLVVIVLLLIPIYILKQSYFSDASKVSKKDAEYVGKESCIECHQTEYNDWTGSDHDLAMDYANDSTVLGNFNNVILNRGNQQHKAYKKGNKFFVLTDGADGKMHEYQVKYVFGYYPLQNYLVEFPGGRLQTLALTWNSKDSNWYYMADSVYKEMSVTHNNWLHWTNQAQNWNSMCADCHSTNLKKGYDHKTDSYHTTWSEIDVSCEACHGPASKHLEWAKLPEDARKEIKNDGLPIKTSGINSHQYVDNCAHCHSRRTAFGDFNPYAKSIYDNIIPELPTEPNWYIDGQIKAEDYVYGSLTQSRMYMEHVACNNCHNVHSGKLKLQGNTLCLQCHKAADYNTKSHTFHKNYGEKGEAVISKAGVKFEVGSGSQCINCHMHGQNFMGVDYRRDHSFRIPRPDLSEKNGTPNACNQCHKNKSNRWASNYIKKWFGENRPFQYGQAFSAALSGEKNADSMLRAIFNDSLYPPSVKALAVNYLSGADSGSLIFHALSNTEPAIRIAAVRKLNITSKNDLEKLLPLLFDKTKAIRAETGYKLSFVDTNLIPNNYRKQLRLIDKQRLATLMYNADFPIGKYNVANYYYQKKEYSKAEQYYMEAIEQDSELNMAKFNLANLYSAMGKPEKAEKILQEYVLAYPEDANGLYSYGLILSENKNYTKSLQYLTQASKLMPFNSRVDYNIAMLWDFFGDKEKAEEYLKLAIKKNPKEFSNYVNLFDFYNKDSDRNKAYNLAKKMHALFPDR